MNELDSFRRAVNKQFIFLCQRGFSEAEERKVGESDCFLEYSSDSVSIVLYYGPPEFRADLSFWRKAAPETRFGPGDLLVVGQLPKSWKAEIGAIGIVKDVSWLASAVRSVEEPLCSGDIGFYEILTSAQDTRASEWRREHTLRLIRGKAEKAWKEKNFDQVVSLYNAIRTELTALEDKRLSYAEKKLRR